MLSVVGCGIFRDDLCGGGVKEVESDAHVKRTR